MSPREISRRRATTVSRGRSDPIAASSTYSAEEVSGHAGNVGPFAGVLSIASRSPAAISAATPFVLLVGSVTNFEDTPGCTAGFKASYILRN